MPANDQEARSSNDRTKFVSAEAFRATSLRPGMQLNATYEIDSLLASGGMGEVYKGHSIQTGDPVAIKVIRPDLAENEVAIALFRNEASKLHRLYHEAIIRYFLFSVDPVLQRAYLAMEFVEGEPLSQILQNGPLPAEPVRRLAQRIALGLHAAHKRDIIHRDVSSDNIILPNKDVDEAKIIDFGIARSTEAASTIINVGFAGKLNYVSPEQLGLFGGEVTAKSDIYSLGLVLAECLRGEPLDMGGSQFQTIEKRRQVPNLAGIDPAFVPVIEKMLQPKPEDRPESMQAVADYFALLDLSSKPAAKLSKRPIAKVKGGGAGQKPQQPGKRNGLMIASGLGLLTCVVLAGFAYVWLAPQNKPTPVQPDVVLEAPDTQSDPHLKTEEPAAEPVQPPKANLFDQLKQMENEHSQAPQPPALPKTPPPLPRSPQELAEAFIAAHAAAPCFSIISQDVTDTSALIEVMGASRENFDRLNEDFTKAVGFEPDIRAVLVSDTQCAALDFFNDAKAGAGSPQLHLDSPFVHAGSPLAGAFERSKNSQALLVVNSDGTVQNLTSRLNQRPDGKFSFVVNRAREDSQPQILLLAASPKPLAPLALTKPAQAIDLFPAVQKELRETGASLSVGISYFYITN